MEQNNHPNKRRISHEEEEEEGDQEPITNLPMEIIHDILSKLSISSLVQFKCVSKSWRGLAQHPNLVNLYLNSTTKQNDPCLIFHCDFPIRNQLYFADLAASNHKVRKINVPFAPTMPEFDLVGSCNGFICLADALYNDSIIVYNPFTAKYLELPKSLNFSDQEVVFGFGYNPYPPQNYKVVKIIYYRNSQRGRRLIYPQSEVQILTLGTSKWRSLGKIFYQLVRRPSEALVNGKLHWVSRPQRYNPSRRLVSFDLADEKFREVSKPESGSLSRNNYHVLVLKECLSAAVYCNYGRIEIWVMKEYNVKESWVKEYSIGGYIMPKAVKQKMERPYKVWNNHWNGKMSVRVLGVLKNGEILLEYKSRVLATYNPNFGKFKDLILQGTPTWFHTVVHVGSLNWID